MKKILILILLMSGCFILESYAQKVALKSNLLYDATATMNLGLEFGLARKWTLDVPVNTTRGNPITADVSAIGGFNRRFVTGSANVLTEHLSDYMVIMLISI